MNATVAADEPLVRSVERERALRLAGPAAAPRAPIRPEPLSPELVLVHPDLRAEALAALPDRPWESFLPARVEQAPAVPTPLGPERDEQLRVASAQPPYPHHPPSARAPGRARSVWLVVVGAVLGLVVATVLPRPAGPTLEPARTVSPAPARSAPPRTETSRHFAIPGGGYVFGRSGHFSVSHAGTAITGFTATVRCAGSFAIPTLRLRGRRFGWDGTLRPGLRVVLSGRFESRNLARGLLQARSRTCASGRVPFYALLS
jgi:hypothetical protein